MDRYLWAFYVMVVCLAVSISEILGLKCYKCASISVDTDNAVVKTYLDTFTTNAGGCQDAFTKGASNVIEETCIPSSGKVAVCGKTKTSSVSATYSSVTFTGTFYSRGCLEVASASAACGATSSTHKGQLEAITTLATINSFSGTACTCTGDLCNAQTRLIPQKVAWLVALVVAMAVNKLW